MFPNNNQGYRPQGVPAWLGGATGGYRAPQRPVTYGEAYRPTPMPAVPAWLRPQQDRQKHQAGYWQTGDNERLTISQGGNTIRLAPNSYMEPVRPMNWWEKFLQPGPQGGGGVLGVRG